MYNAEMNKRRLSISIFFIFVAGIYAGVISLVIPLHHTAIEQIALITLLTALLSFLFASVTNDYSWTDRLWSISPVIYALIYALHQNFSLPILLPTILVALWGSRLTFNFARRGGYIGREDYRWTLLRKQIHTPVVWVLFNLLFIAFYQQLLFVLFTLPLRTITESSTLQPLSIFAFVLALGFLILETVADQQQFTFQQAKHGYAAREEQHEDEYTDGFRRSGLFAWCRHPNYLGELGFWWSIYLLASSMTGSLLNYTIIGPILLTFLFVGSTAFTESITASKYESYAVYRKEVWPIIPRLWGKNPVRRSVSSSQEASL